LVFLEVLDLGSAVETMLGTSANAQAHATRTLVDRLLYGGPLFLKAEVLTQMTVEQRGLLEDAVAGLGISIDKLRKMIAEAIGDGDTNVIDDVAVEDITDEFESVAVAEAPTPVLCAKEGAALAEDTGIK
jgi:hypothetical protein